MELDPFADPITFGAWPEPEIGKRRDLREGYMRQDSHRWWGKSGKRPEAMRRSGYYMSPGKCLRVFIADAFGSRG